MNSGISRALKKEFHKKMVADLPEFQRAGTATGGTVYRKYDVTTGLYIFVFVQPHSKEDRFTLELGSSLTKDFPFAILPGDHAPNGEARFRINRFLKQKTDGWWHINIPPAVSFLLQKSVYAVSCFAIRRMVSRKNCKWKILRQAGSELQRKAIFLGVRLNKNKNIQSRSHIVFPVNSAACCSTRPLKFRQISNHFLVKFLFQCARYSRIHKMLLFTVGVLSTSGQRICSNTNDH